MPSQENQRVSVVMPVYRLADDIGPNIARVVRALAPITDFEVIVSDDGSDDGTRAAAEAEAARHDAVRVVGHSENAGKGRTVQEGVAAATGDVVVLLDADLDLPPEQLPGVLHRFGRLGVDALVGSKRGSMRSGGYPWLRRVLSRIFSFVTKVAFRLPVSETQTGLKVFRREPLVEVLPQVEVGRYVYDLELLVRMKKAGYEIAETPVSLEVAESGSSVAAGTLWEMGRDTVGLWFRMRGRGGE
jgi:glycosyltransferase involved in cell wall biosynthesis